MRKTLTALIAAATIAVAAVATPTTADARRGWWGPALGAFAAAAIISSAFARPYYYGYYSPYYGGYYGPYGGYYGPSYGGYYAAAPVDYGYAPAPAYYNYAPRPYYNCWRWRNGYRYRVC